MSRSARRFLAGMIASALAALAFRGIGWPGHPQSRPSEAPARPLASVWLDRAYECLALGQVHPPLAALSDAELDGIAGRIARLIAAYQGGEFASFLALRSEDLAFARRLHTGDCADLRALGRELGMAPEVRADDWIETLEHFWRAYYADPPVAEVQPGATLVWLERGVEGGFDAEAFEASFEARCAREPGPWIRHALVVPHRRSLTEIGADAEALRWLDVELALRTPASTSVRLVVRFVRDGGLNEWFLEDAATVYPEGDREERHLIL